MKAYVSDLEDLKEDPSYQETWDDMVINVSVGYFCLDFAFLTTFYFITVEIYKIYEQAIFTL